MLKERAMLCAWVFFYGKKEVKIPAMHIIQSKISQMVTLQEKIQAIKYDYELDPSRKLSYTASPGPDSSRSRVYLARWC